MGIKGEKKKKRGDRGKSKRKRRLKTPPLPNPNRSAESSLRVPQRGILANKKAHAFEQALCLLAPRAGLLRQAQDKSVTTVETSVSSCVTSPSDS